MTQITAASSASTPRSTAAETSPLTRAPLDAGILAPSLGTAPRLGSNATQEAVLPDVVLDMLDADSLATLAQIAPIFASGDPAIMLAELSAAVDRETRTTDQRGVDNDTARDASAAREQREATDRAERASRRAGRFLGNAPKWVKKLIEAVVVAAAATATAMSGGVAAGLAIAGAVLILSAEGIGKAAEKLGMSPENARWLTLGCQIAGAALMAGGGLAASGATAGTAAQTAQSVSETVSRVASSAQQIEQAVRGTGNAVATRTATLATADARAAGLESQEAQDALRALLDQMQASAARFERSMGAAQDALEARARAQQSLIERMA
jgi:hypothetical protein